MDCNLNKVFFFILVSLFLSCGPITNVNSDKEKPKQVSAFSLSEVELLEGPFKHANQLGEKTLLNYVPDRFLSKFRKNAGLSPKAENYKGWEDQSLAGHSLGHYLSACILMYKTTGNQELLDRANYIVNELALCQEADGDGYIAAFENGKKIFEDEVAKGNIETQSFYLNGIWAPFYTHHKIFAGLRDAYRLTGNKQALDVAKKFADWIFTIISPLNEDQLQKMLNTEHGGMNEILVDLYVDTGQKKYLDMANLFYHKAVLDHLVKQEDSLAGIHANTQFPKVIGLVKRYNVTANEDDYRAASFFWDRVVNHHSYVTGGNGNHEYFGNPDQLSKRISDESTETCNVYNMLKLSDLLFQIEPSAEIADFYERGIINQILSSQNPNSGKVTYNQSLEMGGFKHYEDPFSFTCCVGSGMENHAKYNGNIYYHNEDELYVTQFIASKLDWEEKNFSLTQQTNFPLQQGTQLLIKSPKPQDLTIKIRYPYWAEKGITLKVNGEVMKPDNEAASFISINRTWSDGDKIEVEFPFTKRLEFMPDDSTRVAMMFGPLVLAGELGEVNGKDMDKTDFVPVFFSENKDANAWLQGTDSPNLFTLNEASVDKEIPIKPLYQTHDKRYSVYWDVYSEEEWKSKQESIAAEKKAYQYLQSITYDFVQPGALEVEKTHNYQGDDTHIVEMQDRKARQSERGGWFSFDLKVLRDEPTALVFEYWGGYTGGKTFDIQVDGETIATQNISGMKDGAFLTKIYNIPFELTKGKNKVTVKISPHEGSRGGPVFGIRSIKQSEALI